MSIFHTVVMGIILIVFSGALYFISLSAFQEIDQGLTAKARSIESTIRLYLMLSDPQDPDALASAVRKTITIRPEGMRGTTVRKVSDDWVRVSSASGLDKDYIRFFSADRITEFRSGNVHNDLRARFMEDLHLFKGMPMAFKTITFENKVIRVITYPFTFKAQDDYYIQVGVAQGPVPQLLRNWFWSFVVIFPLILFLTMFMVRIQAARLLKPVRAITSLANTITHQDLSARIKGANYDSDMQSLVQSFNDMIARLEQSFKHVEEFAHQVAHELKTPLTIIKGEADLMLRRARTSEEYQQTLRIILEESERVLRTIEDLLLLSKIDYQTDAFTFEDFDFLEFVHEICEQSQILGNKKSLKIVLDASAVSGPLNVKGDRLHLRRMFFSILDNAIRHSPEKGRVDIRVFRQGTRVGVAITDKGPGISPDGLKKIYAKSFNTGTMGEGLGLNIAWAIAKSHQGEIQADSKLEKGATFTVFLPISPAD